MSESGRVVIPVDVRRSLGLLDGDALLGELRDGELVLTTRRARLEQSRRLFQKYFPVAPDRSQVDELIAERRAEVACEDEELGDRP